MARKLSELAHEIDSRVDDFRFHLAQRVPAGLVLVIDEISRETRVFIFSGVIRDFFLGRSDIRDIDLVVERPIDVEKFFPDLPVSRNSFGGYKVKFDGLAVDLWFLADTWAYRFQKVFEFYPGPEVFQTAFFNFSYILFSVSERRFYYSKNFLRFLRDKEIDVGYPINANYDLCIINTIYYSEKLKLKVGYRLKMTLLELYRDNAHDFQKVQMKHFGSVLYSDAQIDNYIQKLKSELVHDRRLPNI